MNRLALDSNILIYAHENDEALKQSLAARYIQLRPVVSAQVVSEYINVVRRKMSLPKPDLLRTVLLTLQQVEIVPVNVPTIENAAKLIERYDFQIFDAIIVASAIGAGCDTLYSEDMQDGLLVENRLRIINPFR